MKTNVTKTIEDAIKLINGSTKWNKER
jgi:hypothetical protein